MFRYEVVDLHAEIGSKLSHVLFCHHHLLVAFHDGCCIGRKWIEVFEVGLCHLVTLLAQFVHSGVQMTIGGTKTYDEQVGIIDIAFHLKVGHFDVGNLLLTQASHQVVVFRIGRDGTRIAVLLQSTEDMCEPFASRHSPVAAAVFRTHIGRPRFLQLLRNEWRVDSIEFCHLGQFEGAGTISNISIGKQHDGRHVFQRHFRCLISSIEAVCRTCCRHHRHGTLSITSEEHLQEVSLF